MKNISCQKIFAPPVGAAALARLLQAILLYTLVHGAAGAAGASTCYGSAAHGRLQGGVQLPAEGANFVPYTRQGVMLGRNHVHEIVRDIVVAAYAAIYRTMPEKHFMYGETGLLTGGPFPPHRTHQTGTSVDFMVPVVDGKGRSVPLPASALNKFGYGLEFNAKGRLDDLRIDFEALAEHLYQLAEAAKLHGGPIQRVIFQKELVAQLYQTRRGNYLRTAVTFMKATPWIRHDEHYHVDFALPCRPLAEFP